MKEVSNSVVIVKDVWVYLQLGHTKGHMVHTWELRTMHKWKHQNCDNSTDCTSDFLNWRKLKTFFWTSKNWKHSKLALQMRLVTKICLPVNTATYTVNTATYSQYCHIHSQHCHIHSQHCHIHSQYWHLSSRTLYTRPSSTNLAHI